MVKSFLDEIRSGPDTCVEPEKRYEADGKTPYLIRWGEDQHHSGEVTYSWFASLFNSLINKHLSPNTAANPDSNVNTYLTSALPPNGGFPNLNKGDLYVVFEREAREFYFHHSLTHITHELEREVRESQLYHSLMEYQSK